MGGSASSFLCSPESCVSQGVTWPRRVGGLLGVEVMARSGCYQGFRCKYPGFRSRMLGSVGMIG